MRQQRHGHAKRSSQTEQPVVETCSVLWPAPHMAGIAAAFPSPSCIRRGSLWHPFGAGFELMPLQLWQDALTALPMQPGEEMCRGQNL